jgi:hypothetical protein
MHNLLPNIMATFHFCRSLLTAKIHTIFFIVNDLYCTTLIRLWQGIIIFDYKRAWFSTASGRDYFHGFLETADTDTLVTLLGIGLFTLDRGPDLE